MVTLGQLVVCKKCGYEYVRSSLKIHSKICPKCGSNEIDIEKTREREKEFRDECIRKRIRAN